MPIRRAGLIARSVTGYEGTATAAVIIRWWRWPRQPTRTLAAQPEPGSPDPGGLPATAGAVPEPVRAALAGEFAALTARQLLVAQGAAVAGDGVRAGLIARTTGLALEAVLADLDDLARHDLIRAGSGGRFRYRHPLVRRVCYDLAGAGWRVAAHARAAAALRDDGASAAEIAVHKIGRASCRERV